MCEFKLEPHVPLLTVTRSGLWSLGTVASYEAALRAELAKLQQVGRSTAFIIDVRSSGPQSKEVADALTAMVARLGSLHATRTAVVTSGGIAKLQAKRVADANAQVFTSMVLARDWVTANADPAPPAPALRSEPIDATPEGLAVHILAIPDVDVVLTPKAALETAKRIGDAAIEVIVATDKRNPTEHPSIAGGKPS